MKYAKAWAAVIATAMSGVIAALWGDDAVSNLEWINVAILAAGACVVFTAPNVPGARYTKSVLAVIVAVLTLAVQLLADGSLNSTDWLQLGMAAFGALGVYAVPNDSGFSAIDESA